MKAVRRLWRKLARLFRKRRKNSALAMYDGARCKVYLIDGARLVGTVRLQDDPAWILVEGKPRSCLLRVSQIAWIRAD